MRCTLETFVALATTVTAIAVMVLMKTVMQARDFLFATKHARPDVMTLRIVANESLVCVLLNQSASCCESNFDFFEILLLL